MPCNHRLIGCGIVQLLALVLTGVCFVFLFEPNVILEPSSKGDYVRAECVINTDVRRHVDAECRMMNVFVNNNSDEPLCAVMFGPAALNDDYLDDTGILSNETHTCYVPTSPRACDTEKAESACECCNTNYVILGNDADVLGDSIHHRRIIREELGCAQGFMTMMFIFGLILLAALAMCVVWQMVQCGGRRVGLGKRDREFKILDDGDSTFDEE